MIRNHTSLCKEAALGETSDRPSSYGGESPRYAAQRDIAASIIIAKEDDIVGDLHSQVYHELLLYMLRDPITIERATYLIWVSHNLERIADRATNICEQTVYLVTGKMEEINVSKY